MNKEIRQRNKRERDLQRERKNWETERDGKKCKDGVRNIERVVIQREIERETWRDVERKSLKVI